MKYVRQNLLAITNGVIVHQVNCRGRIGGGLSGAIIAQWPTVKKDYLAFCKKTPFEHRLGSHVTTQVSDTLSIVSAFAQENYGNPAKTHRVYTDTNVLRKIFKEVLHEHPGKPVWAPFRIGAGLGGQSWENVSKVLSGLPINIAIRDVDYADALRFIRPDVTSIKDSSSNDYQLEL